MAENPYKAPVETGEPITREAATCRLSPILGVCCGAVVVTCAFIMLSELNRTLDLSACVFLGFNATTCAAIATIAFANKKQWFYISLLFDVAAFFSAFAIFPFINQR